MEFLFNIFDTSDFPARWHCGRWTAGHGWLHIFSDIGVWSAYFAIPCVLLYFIWRRQDLPFRRIFLLFGAFILFCGMTHLMEAIIFWWPAYRLAGVLKLATAIVSWTTVFALMQVAPKVMLFKSPEELEREVALRTAELVAVTSKLAEEREWFSTTLASIGDAVITTDTQGRVTMLNQVAISLTGWSQEEAKGQPLTSIFNIVNEETRQPVENPALRALQEGVIVGLANHTILIAKDGTERPIDDSAAPIRSNKGEVVGGVLVFRDITERHRQEAELRKHERQFHTLAESIPQLAWMANSAGHIFWYNQRWYDYTGTTLEQMDGWGWQSVHDPDELPHVLERWNKSIATGQSFDMVFPLKGNDGVFRPFLTRIEPVKDDEGQVVWWFGTNTDITEQKRAEDSLRSSETRLRESEANYRLIVEKNPALICRFKTDGTLTFVNDTYCLTFGKARDELIGQQFVPVIPAEDETVIDRAFAPLAPDIEPFMDEHRVVVAGGAHRWLRWTNNAVLGDDGTFIEYQAIGIDITDRKQAEDDLRRSEERFRGIFTQTLAGIAETDLTGRFVQVNRRFCEIVGRSEDELFGLRMQDVTHPDDLPRNLPLFTQAVTHGTPFTIEKRYIRPDGSVVWVHNSVSLIRDERGQPQNIVAATLDITEHKRLENELRQVAANLSEADRRKDEFLATLAHELRNPLAPIRMGLELMKLSMDDPATLEEIRDTMERQTLQLIMLVDDLLDVSRITSGKLELRKCQVKLTDVLTSAMEASAPFINEAGHELNVNIPEQPIFLNADPHRLAQVVLNLLNNSAKYTPEGGCITLNVEPQGSEVRIVVQDNGIGIPVEMQTRIFEMFAQIDRPMEKGYTGLGIGLTLVKSLVNMHGGRIDVSSEGVNQGSEFRVQLPILAGTSAHEQVAEKPHDTSPQQARRKVLVVDDNTSAATMLSMVVKILGCEVRIAADGEEAIRVAAEFLPDVVLMDIGMPRMNGYEAAREIRQHPWGEKMMLIALTGWGQDEDKQRTKEAGFDFHLVKPAELRRLLAIASSS